MHLSELSKTNPKQTVTIFQMQMTSHELNQLKAQWENKNGKSCYENMQFSMEKCRIITTLFHILYQDMYLFVFQIVLGGWYNTKSEISDSGMIQEETITKDILSHEEFRFFWISWENGRVLECFLKK